MALPLVVPSFIYALVAGTALGPRGLVQKALEGPFGVSEIPNLYGFPAALLALALLTYPYVLLPTMAALRRLDPRARRGQPLSRPWSAAHVCHGDHSCVASGNRRRCAPCRPLHPF